MVGVAVKLAVSPVQIEASPVIETLSVTKGVTETLNVCAVLLPQLLFAITEIEPPEAPTVVVIEVEVEEPDHPEGSDQV